MIASIDENKVISTASIPRDTARIPLPGGGTYQGQDQWHGQVLHQVRHDPGKRPSTSSRQVIENLLADRDRLPRRAVVRRHDDPRRGDRSDHRQRGEGDARLQDDRRSRSRSAQGRVLPARHELSALRHERERQWPHLLQRQLAIRPRADRRREPLPSRTAVYPQPERARATTTGCAPLDSRRSYPRRSRRSRRESWHRS